MNDIVRLALPVPPIGTSLGDAGDAYVSSLAIQIAADGQPVAMITGTIFEELFDAVRLRHLGFHPRTRAFVAGSIPSDHLRAAIERLWASIDSYGDDVFAAAETISAAAAVSKSVAWSQTN